MATSSENTIAKATQEVTNDEKETNGTEEVAVEPKTGVSFPVKLDDGKQLNCVGLRKKSMVMGQASDDIKLTPGSLIEISRLPGFVLKTKVMGEVISKVESELLWAYINMYIGDDPLDKDAKDKFGISLISLF
ncbi:hypothetical protein Goklo_023753 [Gossypium klotzschianum]|uniref:Uncharacterized protein n=1 Tax=Gossypium klotzschianum TaxID=34286 RepID=A0A7J8TRL7_9ROSI|nr:hypothetical protein [Gossypium klotzschianum]